MIRSTGTDGQLVREPVLSTEIPTCSRLRVSTISTEKVPSVIRDAPIHPRTSKLVLSHTLVTRLPQQARRCGFAKRRQQPPSHLPTYLPLSSSRTFSPGLVLTHDPDRISRIARARARERSSTRLGAERYDTISSRTLRDSRPRETRGVSIPSHIDRTLRQKEEAARARDIERSAERAVSGSDEACFDCGGRGFITRGHLRGVSEEPVDDGRDVPRSQNNTPLVSSPSLFLSLASRSSPRLTLPLYPPPPSPVLPLALTSPSLHLTLLQHLLLAVGNPFPQTKGSRGPSTSIYLRSHDVLLAVLSFAQVCNKDVT